MKKFKKDQLIKSYHCPFNCIVIGYKDENYLLAYREGTENKMTDREILYDKHCFLVE